VDRLNVNFGVGFMEMKKKQERSKLAKFLARKISTKKIETSMLYRMPFLLEKVLLPQ
jgi:hypothetical protein